MSSFEYNDAVGTDPRKANELVLPKLPALKARMSSLERMSLSSPQLGTASRSDAVVMHQRRRHSWENHHIASLSSPLLQSYNPINLSIRGNIYIQSHALG